MLKHFNTFVGALLLNQFILTSNFFLSRKSEILLIPSVVFRDHANDTKTATRSESLSDWIVHVQGWFFEEHRLRTKLAKSALSAIVSKVDKQRVSAFTATGKKHKTLCINGLQHEICTKTDAQGLFKTQFRVTNDELERFRVAGGTQGKVEYSVTTTDDNIRNTGEGFLCDDDDDDGISFISDIDDTIKVTGVTSVRSVLRNTFSGQYKAVEGMAHRYRHYESFYNATFHYLTASPDQLYPFLREFLQREKFPLGSYHMRHFTWFDANFFEFFSSESFIKEKTHILNMFLQGTRSRKFILVGDIFQKDPEIYANVYEKYPERILKILIRVSNKTDTNRLNPVFQHIPKYKWSMFLNGFDLPDKLF